MKSRTSRPYRRSAAAIAIALGVSLAACAPQAPTNAGPASVPDAPKPQLEPAEVPTPTDRSATPASPSATTGPAAPATAHAARPESSLPEPATPPAASSPQAAATLVETYFAMLGAKRDSDAAAAWGANAAQAADFHAQYVALGRPNVEVDAPGGEDGAAGSIYVTVAVRFLPTAVGNGRPRMGEVVVRRVNDVPGATEAQRRWHIERIDVAMTPK